MQTTLGGFQNTRLPASKLPKRLQTKGIAQNVQPEQGDRVQFSGRPVFEYTREMRLEDAFAAIPMRTGLQAAIHGHADEKALWDELLNWRKQPEIQMMQEYLSGDYMLLLEEATEVLKPLAKAAQEQPEWLETSGGNAQTVVRQLGKAAFALASLIEDDYDLKCFQANEPEEFWASLNSGFRDWVQAGEGSLDTYLLRKLSDAAAEDILREVVIYPQQEVPWEIEAYGQGL